MHKYLFGLVIVLCLALFGCQANQEPMVDVAQQQAEAMAQKYVEIYSSGNMDLVAEVIDTAYVGHGPVSPEPIVGQDGFKAWVQRNRDQFSDLTLSFDRVIAKGEWVTFKWRVTGTNDGPMMEYPPTGQKMDIWGVTLSHVVNGKTVEEWFAYDLMTVYNQLGFKLVPPKVETGKKK
ncbi:MAG: ester cyclase [Candidatus Zixiibacteriota bacterium]